MNRPMKQYEVLTWASSFLEKHNREENIAEILLQYHLGVSRTEFFMRMREEIAEDIWHAFEQDIKKHAITGMPVQHITGVATFFGREFAVSPAVLIPRFETEELVEQVLQYISSLENKRELVVVDIGTGSGIIATTVKLEIPELTVYATDISATALEIAKKNAHTHQADIHFLQGNFLEPFLEKQLSADIIISNPPYISQSDESILRDTVKHYDPSLALYAEDDGLAAYKEIIAQTKQLKGNRLKRFFFEIGYHQAEAVTSIFQENYKGSRVQVKQDINEKDRMIITEI